MESEIQRQERETDYAYVEDVATSGLRQVFIRLCRPGEGAPAETVHGEGVDIDLDARGNVIGVSVFWRQA
jgi:hypothetical protein